MIKEYKEGNKERLVSIIEIMNPLVNKYARYLFNLEFEDMKQELIIAIIEAVNKIGVFENEFQCLSYLKRGVINRYYELCKISKKREGGEELCDKEIMDSLIVTNNNFYDNIEFELDMIRELNIQNSLQRKIAYYVLVEEISDIQISEKLKVSRQYVNRSKKVIFANLLSR